MVMHLPYAIMKYRLILARIVAYVKLRASGVLNVPAVLIDQ